jgi:signal transduction histidine kinase
VTVRVGDGEVLLSVEDDGVGTDPAMARGGVVNMGERAHDLGGTFELGPAAGGTGTLVTWRAPLGT